MSALAVVGGYLLGSMPFALWLGGSGIRHAGSGNPGAANVLRVRRTSVALAVLVLDVTKGAAAVLLAEAMGGDASMTMAAGGAAIIGHVYPVWLAFCGGKGVATTFGVFSILAPPAAAVSALLFAVTVWTTRYVSVGSLVALVSLPGFVYLTGTGGVATAGAGGAALLVVFRHRTNLARLHGGTEHRLGGRSWSGEGAPTEMTRK